MDGYFEFLIRPCVTLDRKGFYFPDLSTRRSPRAVNLCRIVLAPWITTPRAARGGNADAVSLVRPASSTLSKTSGDAASRRGDSRLTRQPSIHPHYSKGKVQ